jgi:hypothetical protein
MSTGPSLFLHRVIFLTEKAHLNELHRFGGEVLRKEGFGVWAPLGPVNERHGLVGQTRPVFDLR